MNDEYDWNMCTCWQKEARELIDKEFGLECLCEQCVEQFLTGNN